jgi:hypothetical protein
MLKKTIEYLGKIISNFLICCYQNTYSIFEHCFIISWKNKQTFIFCYKYIKASTWSILLLYVLGISLWISIYNVYILFHYCFTNKMQFVYRRDYLFPSSNKVKTSFVYKVHMFRNSKRHSSKMIAVMGNEWSENHETKCILNNLVRRFLAKTFSITISPQFYTVS